MVIVRDGKPVMEHCRQLLEQGEELDEIIKYIHSQGHTKGIAAAMLERLGVDPSEVYEAVVNSDVWQVLPD